jgi:hypothetical protein
LLSALPELIWLSASPPPHRAGEGATLLIAGCAYPLPCRGEETTGSAEM